MSKQTEQPEVIDPSDPRYRHPDDINRRQDDTFHNDTGPFQHTYVRQIGCTPVGCLPGCLFSIIISILLTLLLNLIF
ncbi:hypothetical protein [Staphylococcus cornubiensis]|uniref:hypothetical protein n=1 Tax=Staphylococcus cornubiensis TaxID=1986155 RepID=UPI000A3869C0|nr:hypothetical protein [Staphylococcus cornubiensis]